MIYPHCSLKRVEDSDRSKGYSAKKRNRVSGDGAIASLFPNQINPLSEAPDLLIARIII